jgi:hypothetical protein
VKGKGVSPLGPPLLPARSRATILTLVSQDRYRCLERSQKKEVAYEGKSEDRACEIVKLVVVWVQRRMGEHPCAAATEVNVDYEVVSYATGARSWECGR